MNKIKPGWDPFTGVAVGHHSELGSGFQTAAGSGTTQSHNSCPRLPKGLAPCFVPLLKAKGNSVLYNLVSIKQSIVLAVHV